MKKIINRYTLVLIVIICTSFSCSNDENLNNLNETIFVRHENADMPAYIHGNASEKVFLIILHGGPGGFGLSYRNSTIKSEIEKECAVVYFDQRGSGMSQSNYSESGISIDIMAQDVLALVKVIQHKYGKDSKLFLMGHSWGGTLGPATLLKDQSTFLGWINVDGSGNTKGLYKGYIDNFKRVGNEQIALGNHVEYWNSVIDLANNVPQEYKNIDDAYRLNSEAFIAEEKLEDSGLINKQENLDGKTIYKYNVLTLIWNMLKTQSILDEDLFENIDLTDQFSEITIPSLTIWGKHDMIVPIAFAQESFDNLGSTEKELVIFEQSGHSPMFSEPQLFSKTVIAFINKNK
ncbi:alpha/beta fold hydrolase [Hyunsoonleella ulvae]|uniref:alpha/beta fold hydrolase n=1 Tax=Hyunsoonleella ulvae TaxID=2799948 RepID=UPI00193A11C1|nr:alpha/beta hydrolase [Hyunsoonleella ulvae]